MFKDYAYQQTEPSECGLACVAASAAILGDRTELQTLRRRFPVSRGLTLKQLTDIAAAIGLASRSVRCEINELKDLKTPAILHFGLKHFVVLERVHSDRVYIFDPAKGRCRLTFKEISALFTGVATEITATPTFQRRRPPAALRLTSLFRWTPQLIAGLVQVLILSILLELYVVGSPYYVQLAIDEAALKGDSQLLVSLALGFGAFAVFNIVATTLRSIVLQRIAAILNWDMTQGMFHHLLRLPLPWFQRRRLADILARFQSLDPVKSLVGSGLIGAVMDGCLSIATVLMMYIYSPLLASIVVASLIIYILIRLVGIPTTRGYASKAIIATIAEQGKRIESLRAIQTIKSMGAESERESDWANRFADTIGASQKSAIANIVFSTIHDIAGSCANILVVAFGASGIIQGHMTVGMLYAFMAYQSQFLGRASSLFEQVVSWRMLDLYTHRIADIALTPAEAGIDKPESSVDDIMGKIEVRDLCFRYSSTERPILTNLDMSVHPGEFIAIVGPSGSGKSTLLKVLTGLYPPSSGEVYIDGLPLNNWGPRTVRRSMGVVMQDDELLSGTIADNVAFFSEHIDMDRVWECLELASIEDEVRKMPMGAETFVGDMGSAVSGGQKQRLLLARALYRRPKILLLDEATSHLDVQRESIISDTLKGLAITRIVIAHRPETITAAHRVLEMREGSIHVRQSNAPADDSFAMR